MKTSYKLAIVVAVFLGFLLFIVLISVLGASLIGVVVGEQVGVVPIKGEIVSEKREKSERNAAKRPFKYF